MAPEMHLIKLPVSITCYRQCLVCVSGTALGFVVANQNEMQTVTHLKMNGGTGTVLVDGCVGGCIRSACAFSLVSLSHFYFCFLILRSLPKFKTERIFHLF